MHPCRAFARDFPVKRRWPAAADITDGKPSPRARRRAQPSLPAVRRRAAAHRRARAPRPRGRAAALQAGAAAAAGAATAAAATAAAAAAAAAAATCRELGRGQRVGCSASTCRADPFAATRPLLPERASAEARSCGADAAHLRRLQQGPSTQRDALVVRDVRLRPLLQVRRCRLAPQDAAQQWQPSSGGRRGVRASPHSDGRPLAGYSPVTSGATVHVAPHAIQGSDARHAATAAATCAIGAAGCRRSVVPSRRARPAEAARRRRLARLPHDARRSGACLRRGRGARAAVACGLAGLVARLERSWQRAAQRRLQEAALEQVRVVRRRCACCFCCCSRTCSCPCPCSYPAHLP